MVVIIMKVMVESADSIRKTFIITTILIEFMKPVDFSYIEDFLTKKEALQILNKNMKTRKKRIKDIEKNGFPGYTTGVGWSGYSDDHVV